MPTLPIYKKPKPQRQQSGQRPVSNVYHNATWQRTTRLFRTAHPICEVCYEAGILTDVSPGGRKGVTDHIVRILNGGSPTDARNLCAMCNDCHAYKSAKEAHGWTPQYVGEYGERIPHDKRRVMQELAAGRFGQVPGGDVVFF